MLQELYEEVYQMKRELKRMKFRSDLLMTVAWILLIFSMGVAILTD